MRLTLLVDEGAAGEEVARHGDVAVVDKVAQGPLDQVVGPLVFGVLERCVGVLEEGVDDGDVAVAGCDAERGSAGGGESVGVCVVL